MSQQCNEEGYAGNDTLCARDSDRDNFPDVELDCDDSTCLKVATLHNCIIYCDFMLRTIVLLLLVRRENLVSHQVASYCLKNKCVAIYVTVSAKTVLIGTFSIMRKPI